jgi:hypothetical protein
LAVQIIAAGFSGLRLLRQSQQHMTQDYIDVYGNAGSQTAIAASFCPSGLTNKRRVTRRPLRFGR